LTASQFQVIGHHELYTRITEAIFEKRLRPLLKELLSSPPPTQIDGFHQFEIIDACIKQIDHDTIQEGQKCLEYLKEGKVQVMNHGLAFPSGVVHFYKFEIENSQLKKCISVLKKLNYYPETTHLQGTKHGKLDFYKTDESQFRIRLIIKVNAWNKLQAKIRSRSSSPDKSKNKIFGPHLTTAPLLFGCNCVGYELNEKLATLALNKVLKAKLTDRITIHHSNALDADLTKADKIFMFLPVYILKDLVPQIVKKMSHGASLIIHEQQKLPNFDVPFSARPFAAKDGLTVVHTYTKD